MFIWFLGKLNIFPLISPSDIVSINFDLTEWYCQYQPLISMSDIVSINFDLTEWYCQYQLWLLTISLSEIKGWYWQYHSVRSKVDTDNITQWDQSWYWQYHSLRSMLILTISLSEIKVDTDNITQWDQSWYWQYHSLRSKVDTDNITNSVISWRSILLVEETGVPGENHRPVASHWQTLL
jgi:hypothetical protein